MSKKTITRETDRSFAERALYQLLVLLIPSIMAGEHTEAGLLQIDRDMALTFVREADVILMINQFYNLNTDMETLTQYMVLLDRSNELATPLAVILTAPPASCACEAREDMTDYLISLLCLAGSRDFQYTTR